MFTLCSGYTQDLEHGLIFQLESKEEVKCCQSSTLHAVSCHQCAVMNASMLLRPLLPSR